MDKEAIVYYEFLIKDERELIESLSNCLEREMRARNAVFGDRILCPFLRPNFISATEYDRITKVVGHLMQAVAKIYEVVREVDGVRAQLDLSPQEEKLASIDPGYRGFSVTSRIDSFLTEDSLQFVELNAETPAGLAYQDVLSDLFLELPVMKEFSKKYVVHRFNIQEKLLQMLLDVYKEFCAGTCALKKDLSHIAIVDWKDVPTRSEFEIINEFFERKGFKAIIADPRELDYRNGKLYAGDFPIDLVYRRIVTSEFLEAFDETHPLIEAYRNHDVCVINHFRTKLTHKKMIFGLLSDEQNEKYFSEQEREIVRDHIPWTRKVKQGTTQYKGKQVDLCPFILDNKDRLVMKPNDKYGGKGIYIGWESTKAEWEAALKEALESSYVVQEKVRIAQEMFPGFSNGQLTSDPFLVDLDPYIFYGREVYGCLTRLSGSALCNVSSGGGQVPTFVIESRTG